jgi:hypothetical protein
MKTKINITSGLSAETPKAIVPSSLKRLLSQRSIYDLEI